MHSCMPCYRRDVSDVRFDSPLPLHTRIYGIRLTKNASTFTVEVKCWLRFCPKEEIEKISTRLSKLRQSRNVWAHEAKRMKCSLLLWFYFTFRNSRLFFVCNHTALLV